MSATNPLSALAAAELAAAIAPIQAALANIASGDGSVESVTAQWIALQGEMLALAPTLQKIGIPAIATDLNGMIASWLASVTPAPAVPEKADDEAKSGKGENVD